MPRNTWPWPGSGDVAGCPERPRRAYSTRRRDAHGGGEGPVKGAGAPRVVLYLEGHGARRAALPPPAGRRRRAARSGDGARARPRGGARRHAPGHVHPARGVRRRRRDPRAGGELQAALDEAQIDLEVRTGAELAWYDVPELGEAELEIVAQGPPAPPLAAARGAAAGDGHARGADAPARRSCAIAASACSSATPSARPRSSRRPAPSRACSSAGDRLQLNGSSLTGYHGAARPRRGARARRRRPRDGGRLRRASARRARAEPERGGRRPAPPRHSRPRAPRRWWPALRGRCSSTACRRSGAWPPDASARGRGRVAQAVAQLGEAHALVDDQDARAARRGRPAWPARGRLTATGMQRDARARRDQPLRC